MKKKKNYDTLKIVLEKFAKEQKKHPFEHVTKNQVYTRIKRAFQEEAKLVKEPLFSYRTMERKIDVLCEKKIVKKDAWGVYWLMKNWKESILIQQKARESAEKEVQFLKQQKRKLLDKNKSLSKEKSYFKGGYNAGKHFLDALIYCDSEEDWALLEAFFHKMYANKMEQTEREYYEDLVEGYGESPDDEED